MVMSLVVASVFLFSEGCCSQSLKGMNTLIVEPFVLLLMAYLIKSKFV